MYIAENAVVRGIAIIEIIGRSEVTEMSESIGRRCKKAIFADPNRG